MERDEFSPKAIRKVCVAALGLCTWVRTVYEATMDERKRFKVGAIHALRASLYTSIPTNAHLVVYSTNVLTIMLLQFVPFNHKPWQP